MDKAGVSDPQAKATDLCVWRAQQPLSVSAVALAWLIP